jgi:2-polyprenyl-3-methyl-5-hydroxy-6-metoxy-1,4-benzoquinol methylase
MKTKSTQVKDFFEQTDIYLHKDFGVKTRCRIARDLFKGKIVGKKIIDIGCGNGDVSLQFIEMAESIHFLDISSNMLEIVNSKIPPHFKHKIQLFNCDLNEFINPFQYDVVIAFGLIMHVNNPMQAIDGMAHLMVKDGYLLTQFTNCNNLITKINFLMEKNSGSWINKIDESTFIGFITKANFKIIKHLKYSLLIKGLGKLPNSILLWFHILTYTNKRLSKWGMDHVYLLQK